MATLVSLLIAVEALATAGLITVAVSAGTLEIAIAAGLTGAVVMRMLTIVLRKIERKAP